MLQEGINPLDEALENAQNVNETVNFNDIDAIDVDLFSDDFGGESSGIDDLFLEKFKAGINENCLLTDISYKKEESWSGAALTFANNDGLEQTFTIFAPKPSIQKDDETGQEFKTWNPLIMKDAQGRPLDNADARRRDKGGIPATDENGRKIRNAQRKLVYRNETEGEAKIRKIQTFKSILNSIIACFCRDNMKEAWKHFAMNAKGVKSWSDYTDKIIETLNEYGSYNDKPWNETPIRLKLYRKYDSTTSNNRSEKYMELPKTLTKGLFMERMLEDTTKHVVVIDQYEMDNYISAPSPQVPQAGLNTNATDNNLSSLAGMGMGMTGMPQLPGMI